MPRGRKSACTDKQQRQAAHIEASEKPSGTSPKSAERIAWATVTKQDGGGTQSGSGRTKSASTSTRTKASTRTKSLR